MHEQVHRAAYRNAINTIEGRVPDEKTGQMVRQMRDGRPVSKYVVNREEQGYKKIKLTRSYLRTEILLTSNLTSYNFALLTNQVAPGSNGINPTEQRLKQQDVFFCHRLGFYIYCAATSGGTTIYRYQLMTFPNPSFYGSSGLQLEQMMGLWTTGQLQVTVNNDVLTPAWDLLQHMIVNQSMTSAVYQPTSNYFNQNDYTKDGLVVVEPNWVLNGGNDNEYVISYPQSLSSIGLGTSQMWLTLKFEGFLAQNCSSIMDNH